jgi:hypothetical protein
MSTEAKIEANRANAQHSTGPRTDEGKARSSQNARQHGLSSRTVFVPAGREEEFTTLMQKLFAEVRPVGEIQMQYFEQLTHAAWHTNLARELLTLAYDSLDEKKITLFSRLLGQHERAFTRSHKMLQQLQTDLALRAAEENEPIADLPMVCQVKVITNEATKLARSHPPADRPTHEWATLVRIGAAFRPPAAEPEAA